MWKEIAKAINDLATTGGRLTEDSQTFVNYVMSDEYEEIDSDSEQAAEHVQTVFDRVSDRLDKVESRVADVETEVGDILSEKKQAAPKTTQGKKG